MLVSLFLRFTTYSCINLMYPILDGGWRGQVSQKLEDGGPLKLYTLLFYNSVKPVILH